MPLPEPTARRHLHTRTVTFRGFLREDGLWDIEGEMADGKTYAFEHSDGRHMDPGMPVHHMAIRITVDEDMTIRAIASSMDSAPFGDCQQGNDPMQKMVGAQLGPGWRQAIEKALGGVGGCTHLRELLFNMATAAYQTVFPWRERERRLAGVTPQQNAMPPYHLGRCIAWDQNGPLVQRHYPQFFGQPLKRQIAKKA
jgi:hypothetical protein